jgi:biopolymer transport protein ExbD
MRRSLPSSHDDEAADEPLINLTPLIDVVFVVLITFMMIAPVLDTDRVQLASHGAGQKKSFPGVESLAITVHADNSISVDHCKVSLPELEKWLGEKKKRCPMAVPKLIHDSRAQFGTYQSVKNRIEACGFEEMDVILQAQ